MLQQQLPHNKDIENAVIAGFIIENEEVREKIHEITEEFFYCNTNKYIFNSIKELIKKEKTVDAITVSDLLKNEISNSLEIVAQICELYYPNKFGVYLEKLKEYKDKRTYVKKAMDLIDKMQDEQFEDRLTMKNEVTSLFDIDVSIKSKVNYDSESISIDVLQEIEDGIKGTSDSGKMNYGLKELDGHTAGLHNGELTVLSAGTGQGKTTFALQAMIRLAVRKNNCVLFSQEMTRTSIAKRMISNMTGIDGNKIRQPKCLLPEEFDKIARTARLFSKLPIHINDECSYIEEITEYCRKLKNKGELDIIIVDYLGLCKSLQNKSNVNREREISQLSWGFKKMSREFNVPVILLSQLNRNSANEQREPRLSDLRDSGSVEQDADNVIFLHEHDEETNEITLILAKQRNGATGSMQLKYQKSTFSFYDV